MQLRGADEDGEGLAGGLGPTVCSRPLWGWVSPEVQDGVGNGRGPVVKGFDDDGETYKGPVRFPGCQAVTMPIQLVPSPHPHSERNQSPAAQA